MLLLVQISVILAVFPSMGKEGMPEATSSAGGSEGYTKAKVILSVTHESFDADNDQYLYRLTAQTPSAPLPDPSTLRIRGNGAGNFGEILYDAPGDYRYQISDESGFPFYQAEVSVTADERGVLTADVAVTNLQTGKKTDKILFREAVMDLTSPEEEPSKSSPLNPQPDLPTVPQKQVRSALPPILGVEDYSVYNGYLYIFIGSVLILFLMAVIFIHGKSGERA